MTNADQDEQERRRIVLRIAVHEAGHGVITVLLGYNVSDIYVDIDLGAEGHTAAPADLPDEHAVRIALAGYAAVGGMLGAAEEQANRDADDPNREDSDDDRVRKALANAGVAEVDRAAIVDRLDLEVRDALALPHIGDMVEELAIRLRDYGGALGPVVKAIVEGHLDKRRRETGEDGNPFR